MNLSKDFTLEELTVTHVKIPNEPSQTELESLKALVENVLQPLRDLFGDIIKVNSGFRSLKVNKAIGGADKPVSQHCKGEAADLSCADNAAIFNLIREKLPYDQLIWEGGNDQQPNWVHVSFKQAGNRKQVLRMKMVDGKRKYIPI